ncbi:MAG: hypothetical protein CL798_01040 [Chromatiales bacterium]|nr:hypothetical protein [Chromatiales bacterium]
MIGKNDLSIVSPFLFNTCIFIFAHIVDALLLKSSNCIRLGRTVEQPRFLTMIMSIPVAIGVFVFRYDVSAVETCNIPEKRTVKNMNLTIIDLVF